MRKNASSCLIRSRRKHRLRNILIEQVRDTALDDEGQGIAELLIGNIDDYGYLNTTIEELAASTSLPPEKISEVLKVDPEF